MQIQTYEQRVLTPDSGKYLYNEKARSISEKVYLGVNAEVADWVEIDENEKARLEKEWEKEANEMI